jgi:hypothetical protein
MQMIRQHHKRIDMKRRPGTPPADPQLQKKVTWAHRQCSRFPIIEDADYLGQNAEGIQVIDQWMTIVHGRAIPHVAQPRTIRWKRFESKNASPVNIGDDYYVVQ